MKKNCINWLPTYGQTSFKDGSIYYNPKKFIPPGIFKPDNHLLLPSGTIKSNAHFINGTVSFNVTLDDSKSQCQLVLGDRSEKPIYIGLNIQGAPYGISYVNRGQFEILDRSGYGVELTPKKCYKLCIQVQGSKIILLVDGVEACSAYFYVENEPLSFFFAGKDEITISNIEINSIDPKAFIVMQFSSDFDDIYSEIIRPVCEENHIECVRGDEMYTNTLIIDDIIKSIKESYLVIADITPNNANVFYEIGFAHGINKPVILLCDKKKEKLPFDVNGMRVIHYDNSIAGKKIVEEKLNKHLREIKNHVKLQYY